MVNTAVLSASAGVATTRVNQVAIGGVNQTLTVAGIVSAASVAAQGATTGVITTDADGNLASDGGALQTAVNSNTAAVAANVTAISANAVSISVNNTAIAANLATVTSNTQSIANNGQSILANSVRLDGFDQRMNGFDLALAAQNNRLDDLQNSLAATTAIPDAYLAPSESYAIAGGFSVVEGEIGFGGTISLRASDKWSLGASLGYSGGKAAGKVQCRFAN